MIEDKSNRLLDYNVTVITAIELRIYVSEI